MRTRTAAEAAFFFLLAFFSVCSSSASALHAQVPNRPGKLINWPALGCRVTMRPGNRVDFEIHSE